MDESLQEISATCLEKISEFSNRLDDDEDERVRNLNEKIYYWLAQIDDNDRVYFIKLLSNFSYFDRIKIKNGLVNLFNKYVDLKANQYKTLYMPVTSKNGIKNGADELINIFYRANNISKEMIPSQISEFYNSYNLSSIENIVLIDDIIGSGTTLEYYFKSVLCRYPELIVNKNIYILCLVITNKALERLNKFCLDNGIRAEFIYEFNQQKVFNEGVVYKDKVEALEAKKIVKKYEKRIVNDDIYILGYKNSQLLTAFYYNTPNNTLSTFWMDNKNKNWNSLFKRFDNDNRYSIESKTSTLKAIREKKDNKKKSILELIKKTMRGF